MREYDDLASYIRTNGPKQEIRDEEFARNGRGII